MVYFLWVWKQSGMDVGCQLEDLNTAVVSPAESTVFVILCGLEEKDGLGKVGDFDVWRKPSDWESATPSPDLKDQQTCKWEC